MIEQEAPPEESYYDKALDDAYQNGILVGAERFRQEFLSNVNTLSESPLDRDRTIASFNEDRYVGDIERAKESLEIQKQHLELTKQSLEKMATQNYHLDRIAEALESINRK